MSRSTVVPRDEFAEPTSNAARTLTPFHAPGRRSPVVTACGAVALAIAVACGGDGVWQSTLLDPIPNPSGPVNLGDLVRLNVNATTPCDNPVYHVARVVAIGAKAIVLSDTLNPANGFTTADFQRYAARFDTLVYPLDAGNFGEPTDIDKNGHIAILFTRAVNELTQAHATQYVGGFFYSRDLFPTTPTTRAQACAGSNQGEYFYMLAPDPAGTINGNARSTRFVDSSTTAVLAHEFQHLINASRRLYVNDVDFEAKWLDEGLAHSAEELLFYRESGLSPRSNVTNDLLRSNNAFIVAFNTDMSGNLARYQRFLGSPTANSPYAPNDSLTTRGAIWSLLRYSVDRLDATDGFTAGDGQVVVGPGSAAMTTTTKQGEFSLTVVNTSLTSGGSANYTLNLTSISGAPVAALAAAATSSKMIVAGGEGSSGLARDEAFESRLRDSERTLTPMVAAARTWYASQSLPRPSFARVALSASSSALADGDAATWFKLANGPATGIANLQAVFGTDFGSYVRDWAVSLAVDDIASFTTQYQQRSWNWRSIFPNLSVGATAYPLFVTTLPTNGAVSSATIVAGGAAFYRVVVPANASVSATLGTPGGAANPNLQLVVVRTK